MQVVDRESDDEKRQTIHSLRLKLCLHDVETEIK